MSASDHRDHERPRMSDHHERSMSDKTLTPGELSELLDIPSSTLRRYVKHFGDHLSEDAQLPRGRRFHESDMHTIAMIRDLTQRGYKLEEIPGELDKPIEDAKLVTQELTERAVIKKLDSFASILEEHEKRLEKLEKRPSLWDRIMGRDR